MAIELQPGEHHVVAQISSMGPPAILTFKGEGANPKALAAFWGYVQDSACNWVKFYTIQTDGSYIFNGEFTQRTARR